MNNNQNQNSQNNSRNQNSQNQNQNNNQHQNSLEQVFLYTAGQEKEHAEIYYNHLVKGGCENITS